MNDRFYIGIIIRRIEKKLGWKKVSLWTDNEFKKLSLQIYEDTSISISPQTLKRLFGKVKYKDDYTAQPATKDALARFLDYPDWDAFIRNESHSFHKYISLLSSRLSEKKYKTILYLLMLSFALIIFSFFIFPVLKNREITMHAENVTGVVPHTVSFHLNISNLKNNEVNIDFDQNEEEEKNKGELLDKHLTLINHCFESPGYYNVKLTSRGKLLASTKVHVFSEGWSSYYFNNDNFNLRKFVFGFENRVQESLNDGMLYISPAELNSKGFNGNTVYYLEHLMYKDFQVSTDSCMLKIRYRNSSDIGGISCYDVEFRLVGENGIVSVILVQKGCYRWSEITVGEKHLNGKYNDLSFLSADLSSWNVLKVVTTNHKAAIINNSDTLFTTSYNNLLGQLKGIRFVTKGSGAFDFVRLYNIHDDLIYKDDFGNEAD
jgi:hypothetical protein